MSNSRDSFARALRRAAALSVVAASVLPAQEPALQKLTVKQAVELALKQGLQADAAASARRVAQSRDRAFNARLLPQMSLSGEVPRYNRSIIPVTQPDGTTLFRPQQETNASLNLVLAQQLPFTGANLTMRSRLAQVRKSGADELWNSTPFSIGLEQPILRPNAAKWDVREQGINAEIAERQYLEAREEISGQVTNAFFDFFAAQTALRNATNNAAINDTLFNLNKGRFEVGKIGENDLLQSELALLRARTVLDGARLEYDRTLAALRLALNVAPGTPIEIDASAEVPSFTADTTQAVAQALRNRAAIAEIDLQDVRARRAVDVAKLRRIPGATLNASYGWNASADAMNLAYRDLSNAQAVSVQMSMPVFSWGANSADVQAAQADRQRSFSAGRATREQTAQEAHFAALQLAQSGRQLALSAKADTVAQRRFEVAYNRYVIGRIPINDLFTGQNEKDQALVQFVAALRGYWTAYYRLRRLTLYDFEAGRPIR
jgi:outer membrane protein TolC